MTISTLCIPDLLDVEVRIESTCVVGIDGEFEIDSIELLEFNGHLPHDLTDSGWASIEVTVRKLIRNSGYLVRQIHDDCLNEMNP